MVMYAGKIAEQAPVKDLFKDPKHPYTKGLLNSIPKLGHKTEYLPTIEGQVPSLSKLPKGCRFQDRCPFVMDKCRVDEPVLVEVGPERKVACWLHK
jgi:oligopeptide/dipeptide ABC transporter ATP-binding protein